MIAAFIKSFALCDLVLMLCFMVMPVVSFAHTENTEMQKVPQALEGMGCSKECTKPLTTEQGADLDAMMARFGDIGKKEAEKKTEPELLIFVSLSMPEQSLKLWSEQANRVGATLLLRGLVENSIQKTAEKAQALFGARERGGFAIDPERFEQHQVKAVPAVAITIPAKTTEQENEASDENFDIVYGDTSLEEALQTLNARGSTEVKKVAKEYLRIYRETSYE